MKATYFVGARGARDVARERLYLFGGKLRIGRHRTDAGLYCLHDTLCVRFQFVERRADIRSRAGVGQAYDRAHTAALRL